ncbi:MAG: LLM class F420-dependent oxidoreductase [bacterium]
MRIGLMMALAGESATTRERLITGAQAAEAAGFNSLWFPEHVVLVDSPVSQYPYADDGSFPAQAASGMLEPFVAIAMAAGVTQEIRLGTGICLVPQRSPIYTAKLVADCDVLSGGRLDFGVGIGWLREEFEALGADFDERGHACREYLAAMHSLWTDEVSEHHGRLLSIPPVRMAPKPLQKPSPPIYFGGESDNALRRVADLGQGWYGFNLLPDEVPGRVAALDAFVRHCGRRPAEIDITVSPYLKPARDVAALEAYGAAGVDQVILLVGGRSATELSDNIARLGEELLVAAATIPSARRS